MCPLVDRKFLLGVFCGCIDLKSVCAALVFLSLAISLASVCALYGCIASRLCTTPITLLADGLAASIWFTGSLSNVRKIDWSIYCFSIHITVDVSRLRHHFVCSYRMADWFVKQIATWKHRNIAAHIVYCKYPSVHLKFILMAIYTFCLTLCTSAYFDGLLQRSGKYTN